MESSSQLRCFKAYDVRGKLWSELNQDIAYQIAGAFASVMKCNLVVVGRDCRASSPILTAALITGLIDQGCDVIDLGVAGTEEVYFATTHYDGCGGIEVTASHNPIDYNGMKFVGSGSCPVSPQEWSRIKELAMSSNLSHSKIKGKYRLENPRFEYARKIVGFVDSTKIRPLRILVNPGNGVAGPAFAAIASRLAAKGAKLDFIQINQNPDSSFPNGIPNPLLPQNQAQTGNAVVLHKADLGIAWDGDFDRCFLFDENGRMIEGEYIVALLASSFLLNAPLERIVHDTRLVMNIKSVLQKFSGISVVSKTGHSFVKQKMRDANAIYGGELSAHHYFRDFMFCDSGMIPWLKVIEQMSIAESSLSNLVQFMRNSYPSSGERNFLVTSSEATIDHIFYKLGKDAKSTERFDGLSLEFDDWRMNLRSSNTEPLLRLNVETFQDKQKVEDCVELIRNLIVEVENRPLTALLHKS